MKPQQLLIVFVAFLSSNLLWVNGLLSPTRIPRQSTTAMYGAFNKRNKQGDLLKKMEEARKQREMTEGNGSSDASFPDGDNAKSKGKRISDEELKRENDMKRFEQLLNRESATINYDLDSANYMTKQQEEEEIDAGCKLEYFLQ